MNDSSDTENIFSNIKIIAIVGGTIDSAGNLHEDVKICRVIQAGEDDILVSEIGGYGECTSVVPKSLCVPIDISYERLVAAEVLVPKLEDLVMYYGKLDWKDKSPSCITGILCELTYKLGVPTKAKLLSDGGMKEVDFSRLLVLQKKR
jgi:hypothetical protein